MTSPGKSDCDERAGHLGVAEKFRWACRSEVLAPKAGNVYPGAEFHDLSVNDFLVAADACADVLASGRGDTLGTLIWRCVQHSRPLTQSNANLGIVLLLVPLAKAAMNLSDRSCDQDAAPRFTADQLQIELQRILRAIDARDSQRIFDAIVLAGPGGMGTSNQWDVRQAARCDDMMAAMHSARDRDQIARQYSTGFADVFEHVAPTLQRSIERCGELCEGITLAQIDLLARFTDTLIARKWGVKIAEQVRERAAALRASDQAFLDRDSWQRFDAWLRGGTQRFNPGTTADMIAAGLFVLALTHAIQVA